LQDDTRSTQHQDEVADVKKQRAAK
jgi:hypothetical protein